MQDPNGCFILSIILRFTEQLYTSQIAQSHKEKSEKLASADEMREALQKQMEGHREAHQKQLNELRNEITEKQAKIDELTEYEHHCYIFCLRNFY